MQTFGLTQLTSHHIETCNHPPIAETLRRHPWVYLKVIDQSIDNLARAGIVEPFSSPWAANIVLVKKKGSSVPRVTVDYRKLNEITVKNRFPLPEFRIAWMLCRGQSGSQLTTNHIRSSNFRWKPRLIEIKQRS